VYNWQLAQLLAIKMITKGPIISYFQSSDTWNVYLDGDIDVEDAYIYWCNSSSKVAANHYDGEKAHPVTFKQAVTFVLKKRKYPILVRSQVNSVSRDDDECYILHDDTDTTMAILRHSK
jgi:hypothetical protein